MSLSSEAATLICNAFNRRFAKDRVLIYNNDTLPLNCISVNDRAEILYIDIDLSIYLISGERIKQLYCDLIHSHRQSLIVNEVKFNESGDLFFVRCERSAYVYKLPEISDSDNVCPGFCVGTNYEFTKPSIYIEKVAWHPLSAHHLVILTSDSCIRMFNLAKSHQHPEQTYRVASSSRKTDILIPPTSKKSEKRGIVSFSFGKSKSWEIFSLFCVHRNGSLFGICPFVPYGCLIHRTFFDRLRIDEKGKEYLKKITMIKKNDDFVLTKPPSVENYQKHIFPLKCIRGEEHREKYDEEESTDDEKVKDGSKKIYKFCNMKIITDKDQTYSSISIVSEEGVVKTYLMLDDSHPFKESLDCVCHSIVDINLPNQGRSTDRPIYSEFKGDTWPPYFVSHPLIGEGFLLVHVAGVHEFRFSFLNKIRDVFMPVDVGEEGGGGVESSPNFSFSQIVETVTQRNRNNEPIPPKGVAVISNVFKGYDLLLVDERNRMKSFVLKDFKLEEPELLLMDIYTGKKTTGKKKLKKKLKKKKKKKTTNKEEETEEEEEVVVEEEETEGEQEEEEEEEGHSEFLDKLVKAGFGLKMKALQHRFERVPMLLSTQEGLDETEINAVMRRVVHKFKLNHFQYLQTLSKLVHAHILRILEVQEIQMNDFKKMKEELKKQMSVILKQNERVDVVYKKQEELEKLKEGILEKLEKIRPISIQEKNLIEYVGKKARKMKKLDGRMEALEEKTDIYVGRTDKNLERDEEKNLFFDVNQIRDKMDRAYGEIKTTVSHLEKLEKELKEFKMVVD